jgi:hypothetical protein
MSEHLHPGLHLDADSLSAFAEGVLPEHERLQCLAHIAECARCRELAFLAQEPPSASTLPNPVPFWRRWFAPVPVLTAAAAICIAGFVFWLYPRDKAVPNTAGMASRVTPQAPPPTVPAVRNQEPAASSGTKPQPRPATKAKRFSTPPGMLSATRATDPPSLPAAPSIAVPPIAESPAMLPNVIAKDDLPRITGTVTDPTGAVIAGATVTLRRNAGAVVTNTSANSIGRFEIAGLPPGQYELRIEAPGFRTESKKIDLQSNDDAAVSSQLSIGSVSETVEVTAAPATLETSTSSVGRARRRADTPAQPRPLPSKLPATLTITSGKVTLAVDSAGALFHSGNAGRSWKAVKPVWAGKVVGIETPAAAFQLTTESGAVWLSRDGTRWSPAPRQR